MKEKMEQEERAIFSLRYVKNTQAGIVIDKIRKASKYRTSERIREIILFYEGFEVLNARDVDISTLCDLYWRCLNVYAGKIETIKYKLLQVQNTDALINVVNFRENLRSQTIQQNLNNYWQSGKQEHKDEQEISDKLRQETTDTSSTSFQSSKIIKSLIP